MLPEHREKPTEHGREEGVSSRRIFWGLVCAIWLQIVVFVFVLVQVSRLKTPMVDWLSKTIELLVRR